MFYKHLSHNIFSLIKEDICRSCGECFAEYHLCSLSELKPQAGKKKTNLKQLRNHVRESQWMKLLNCVSVQDKQEK